MLNKNRPPLHLVLDTNIVLDWLVFQDQHSMPLQTALDHATIVLYSSAPTLHELQRVLAYPQFKLSSAAQQTAYAQYLQHSTQVTLPDSPTNALPRCKDPDDQKFLELAAHIQADALLTKDRALLRFARRHYFQRLGFRVCTLSDLFDSKSVTLNLLRLTQR